MSAGAVAPPLGARLVAETRVVAALGRRSVRQAFRRPQFLAPIIIFPSLFLAVNTGGAGRAVDLPQFPPVHGFLDFQLAGAMLQSTMLAGVSAAIALALDIEIGFIDRLVAAPIARVVVRARAAGRDGRAGADLGRLVPDGRARLRRADRRRASRARWSSSCWWA